MMDDLVAVFEINSASVAPDMKMDGMMVSFGDMNADYKWGLIDLEKLVGWASKDKKNWVLAFGYEINDEIISAVELAGAIHERSRLA